VRQDRHDKRPLVAKRRERQESQRRESHGRGHVLGVRKERQETNVLQEMSTERDARDVNRVWFKRSERGARDHSSDKKATKPQETGGTGCEERVT